MAVVDHDWQEWRDRMAVLYPQIWLIPRREDLAQQAFMAGKRAADAQLWRMRFVSELVVKYQSLGEPYEMARALAESEANDMDEAYRAARHQEATNGR